MGKNIFPANDAETTDIHLLKIEFGSFLTHLPKNEYEI